MAYSYRACQWVKEIGGPRNNVYWAFTIPLKFILVLNTHRNFKKSVMSFYSPVLLKI